jgi:inner membrane protein
MYRTGHFGVALAVASLVVVVSPTPAGVAIATIAVLVERMPDYDQNFDAVAHRGFSHTIWFAILLAGGFGAVAALFGYSALTQLPGLSSTSLGAALRPSLAGRVVAAGTLLGILSHFAGDVITVGTGEYGVQPLWPLSRWEVPIGLCRADSTVGNFLLLVGGVVVAVGAGYVVVIGL